MKRYLTIWLAATGVLLLTTAAINLVVDPYGIFRLVDAKGLNQIKPQAGQQGAMTKAYQVLRVQPSGLILGNSRAEVGFDPAHFAWPEAAVPVYNLALPGTGTRTTLQYLQHLLEAQKGNPPKVIVWGIDFMDFLTDRTTHSNSGMADKKDRRLLANPDGSRNPSRGLQQLRDGFEATFTLGALLDSISTLQAQQNPYSADLTSLGFNPMRDYMKITADEGYWAIFQQRNLENIKSYSNRPHDIFDASGATSPALDDLRRVIKLCRQHGINLRLVIYPYHAHLLEIIQLTGHGKIFENWKRAVVHVAHTESISAGLAPIPLWDFSLFNEYTQSSVPAKGDKKTINKWYWEAGHFKRELGDRILEQILSEGSPYPELGVRLDSTNLESVLAQQQALALNYRQTHAAEVDALVKMAERNSFISARR